MPRRRHKRKDCNSQPVSCVEAEDKSPYLIKKSDTLGRYLVANWDLPEGAVIINEDALVVGPTQDSPPLCLGCYSPIPDNIETSYKCGKCQWPMCSAKCKGLYRRHGHSREECNQLVNCQVASSLLPQGQLYNATVPLRCLLLKEHHPEEWTILMTMEGHNDIRRQLPSIWDYNQKSVVDRIRSEWKITTFSEEDIHTVCGILEVNAFTVGDESLNIRGLYPTSFLIAHSCVANTSHTDDETFHIKIFSSVPISKDELITLSYTNSLQGTKKRREHLKQCKFFNCECVRCKDPTELGTNVSALKCSECGPGHLLASDPLAYDTTWVCNNKRCHGSLSASDVDTINNRIDIKIKSLDHNNIKELENGIQRYSGILHKNHYHLLGMKYTLSQLYGKSAGFLIHQMTEDMLDRKKQICEEVLEVFDALEPGLTQVRALTMYELHAPIMVLTIKKFEMRRISKADICRRLRKVAFYLSECRRILKFDTNSSQEGCIRSAAEDALTQLKSWEPVVGKL